MIGEGTNQNSNAARVEIYGEWGIQVREITAGESYGIMNSMEMHFGLGTATVIDSVKIRWPYGNIEKLCGINTINQTIILRENRHYHE